MENIKSNVKTELDSLIKIAKNYRDGTISSSMFYDILKPSKTNIEYEEYKEYLLSNGVKVTNDSEEVEDSDQQTESDTKIIPYNTANIDIAFKSLSLDLIIARLEAGEIDLLPDFQRKEGLWTIKQKSQLIESLIMRIPLPAFYFDGTFNDKWIVIDGLQRLTALKEFFVEKTLKLQELEFFTDLKNTGVDDMPRAYLRRMKETQLITYIINPGAPENLKYNIFKRINTGGLSLEPQEIRHALYQGFATKFLKKLADMPAFKEATAYGVSTDRMLDREFSLRFIAFYEFGPEKYEGSIDLFLNDTMLHINKNYDESYAQKIRILFRQALKLSTKLFDKFAFRKMPDQEKRRPISKALFETWTSQLARLNKEQRGKLLERKETLINKYIEMFKQDNEFVASINSGKIYSVKKRFEKIDQLIKEVIEK